jgi:SRP54-type protein, GTPase domain
VIVLSSPACAASWCQCRYVRFIIADGRLLQRPKRALPLDMCRRFKAESRDLIIVDTSGRHKQSEALFEEMRAVAAGVAPV